MRRILLLTFLIFISIATHAEDITQNQSSWLTEKLYGNDNSVASLRPVKIFKGGMGYRVYVQNQFRFECDLSFDKDGKPSLMSNCQSRDAPRPICSDIHNPNTMCAKRSNCFQSLPEENQACYQSWQVKEKEIKLNCFNTKKESICRGDYTLTTNRGYNSASKMTIAKQRK